MSLSSVIAVATRFLKNPQPNVLVIKGTWGIGKTYAWNQLIHKHKNEIALPQYSYVSLFGISSISDLRTAIFAKSIPKEDIGKIYTAETIGEDMLIKELFKFIRRVYRYGKDVIREIPYGKSITVGFETVAQHFIKNTIICLDDFERLSAEKISHKDILGLISEFKQEQNCKIVLIFNEEKLVGQPLVEYNEYREKVVDIELIYEPTPKEAALIAISENLPHRTSIIEHTCKLGIKNIRVLRKISENVEMLHAHMSSYHPGVMKQALHTLVLGTWCLYDPNDKKPPFSFLRTWDIQRAVLMEMTSKKDEVPHKHIEWKNLLHSYGFQHIDEFDLSIFNAIERGYIEETGIEHAALSLDAQCRANEHDQSFTDAWNMFHNTFADNKEDLVKALRESFKKSVKLISPINLNGTVSLLRELNENEIADELIEFYINSRESNTSILDLDDYAFSRDITDTKIKERFRERFDELSPPPSFEDIISNLPDKSLPDQAETKVLISATEDMYFNYLCQNHGDRNSRIISSLLRLRSSDEHKSISIKAHAALIRIGKQNLLNAIRVKRYGIDINASASDR